MKKTWKLTLASLKMYLRQREVLLWAFFFPLLLLSVFGFIRFDGIGTLTLGVVNEAGERGQPFVDRLRAMQTLELSEGTGAYEREQLVKGERDLVLVLPEGWPDIDGGRVLLLADREAKPRETQLGALVIQRVLDEQLFEKVAVPARLVVDVQPVATRNLTYVDFLLPGILSMSIMQLGVFGVAFGFVSLKRRGVLFRLKATPLRPADFIAAQVTSRMVVLIAQMVVMVGFGVLVLNLHFVGNALLLLVIGVLGAAIFLSVGFAIAGIARTEDQVPPLANVVSLPMIILSGVFFSRSHLPDFVRVVTEYLPLTYLADGLRSVAIDGAGVFDILPQLAGLGVWVPVSITLAVWLFRWE